MEVRTGHQVPEGRLKSSASNPQSSLLDSEDGSLATTTFGDYGGRVLQAPLLFRPPPENHVLQQHQVALMVSWQ